MGMHVDMTAYVFQFDVVLFLVWAPGSNVLYKQCRLIGAI